MTKKGFTIIPNSIIKGGKRLSDAEFRLYCTISSYDFQKGHSFPGRKALANEMGASVAKIDRVKKKLEEKGGIKKKRRGQGITNIYYLNQFFLSEADDSLTLVAEPSQLIGKQDEGNKTFNNYLPKSKTSKEIDLGEKPNLGTNTQPTGNTQSSQSYTGKAVGVSTELGYVSQPKQKDPRIILHNNLSRVRTTFEKEYGNFSPEKLNADYLSLNTTSCVKGIQYYFWKYKTFFGEEHPLLKLAQLENCFHNFNWMVWKLEGLNLPPSKIDEVFVRAIDRWFGTTTPIANNLNLNHFAGTTRNRPAYSEILERSVEDVLYELKILSDAPKVVHLEDII